MKERFASVVEHVFGIDRFSPPRPATARERVGVYVLRVALAADTALHAAAELACAVANGPVCDHCGESALSPSAARFVGWTWRGPDCQGDGWWCRSCAAYIRKQT